MPESVIKVANRKVTVSNLDKVLYPAGPFTKAQVIDYYLHVGEFLLPHFKNRPVTLVRYPNGPFGKSFYEKNAPGFTPSWVKTFPVPRSEGGVIQYILINDLPTLAWTSNLAALELHPFLHRAPRIAQPTHVVFDLDPGEGADILTCVEVALLVRDLLQQIDLSCFPKVSGSKGIQLYVPLNTPTSYEDTNSFARRIANRLASEHPSLVVSDMAKALRKNKVFIDWSQNTQSKTTVGVYSLRAKRERPFVSMPVKWEELNRAVSKSDSGSLFFEPGAALARLKETGDLFAPVLMLKQALPKESGVASSPPPKSLEKYAGKRNFAKTVEPRPLLPKRSQQGSRRRFVVQKHAAGHLHYDLRLEMHDVLKSWAVPKGMPLKKGEQRSAFATEDHPLEYLDFEGTIPKGQYGGGTVMVWDIGTYEPVEGNYYKGELTVFLTGKKLKGEWMLKRLTDGHSSDGKATWLLLKTNKDAKPIPVKWADSSVLSNRTMQQIAGDNTAVWQSNRNASKNDLVTSPKNVVRTKTRTSPPPQFIPPMRATLTDKLPEGPEWIYEVKWDGYRAQASKHQDVVRLLSLKNKEMATHFPTVVEAVRALHANSVVLDGEIVAIDANGQPSFQALQNRAALGRKWHVVYYAFDLLNLGGEDMTKLPLEQRKEKLKSVVANSDVRYSAHLPGSPEEIIKAVKKAGLEGVLAKRKDSIYSATGRSRAWQKLKLAPSQEFVIGGYNPEGASFSSVLVGFYEGTHFMFAGKVRQGFNPSSRAALLKILRTLKTDQCPFANLPSSKTGHFGEGITAKDMGKLQWLHPKVVAQISFTEWTNYGLLRHATFLGLRDDKEPEDVVKESFGRKMN